MHKDESRLYIFVCIVVVNDYCGLSWNETQCLKIKPDHSRHNFSFQSTPMHMAAERGHNDIVLYLAERHADVNVKNCDKVSVL